MSERVTCRWRYSESIWPEWVWPYATECGTEFTLFEDNDDLAAGDYLYCPKCGKKIEMIEGEE